MGSAISGLLFQPPKTTPLMGRESFFWIDTAHGTKIPAFFVDRQAPLTILFSHSNAEDLGMIYGWFVDFAKQLNVNVMAYDYTGYGKSREQQPAAPDKPIVPTEENVYDDVQAAFNWLLATGMRPDQIILYGRSLGSGPTCYLAQKLTEEGTPCAGVILQSPLLSAYRVVFNFRFTMAGDMFPNIDRVANIESPIFVIHGTRDEIVPFWHGEELFLACQRRFRARPFWVDGAGHNNIESLLRESGAFFEHLRFFMDEWCRYEQVYLDENMLLREKPTGGSGDGSSGSGGGGVGGGSRRGRARKNPLRSLPP